MASLLVLGLLLAVGIAGWPGTAGGQGPDCEALRGGVLAQPVAAWTSLAFVPVGVWAAGYRPMRAPFGALFGAAFVAVGLASFAGHAAATDWARTLDSVAIKAMLVLFVVYPIQRRHARATPAAGAVVVATVVLVVAVELAIPDAGRPLLVLLSVVAVAVSLTAGRRPEIAAGLAVLGMGALVWWLGRSGGPLCEPDGALQLHGMWHILAATGLLTIYRGIT